MSAVQMGIESSTRDLPKGWRWTRLDTEGVATVIMGQSPAGDTYVDVPAGLPFFQGKADFGNLYPTPRKWCTAPSKIAEAGDILISVRAPVGPTNIAKETCCIGRGLAAIRPDRSIDGMYMLYFLRFIEPELAGLGAGSTFEAITRDQVSRLQVPLPPLHEQRAIARQLERDMAKVARLRAAVESQREAVEALHAAYLREVFEGVEAREWPWVRLGDVLQLRKDVVHPYHKLSGPATFVGLEHIEPHTGCRIGSVSIDMATLTGRKPRFYCGDVVYGYLRPYLNKVWVADFDGLCSVDQYVYTVDTDVALTEFVAAYMRSQPYLDRAPIDTTPGQLPRIRTEEVLLVKMMLPPLSEQKRVVGEMDSRMREVARLREATMQQQAAVDALPGALLHEVFGGFERD